MITMFAAFAVWLSKVTLQALVGYVVVTFLRRMRRRLSTH